MSYGIDITWRVHYADCAICRRHTSHLVYRPATQDSICAWCQHRQDRAEGKRHPWPLPNEYHD